LFVSFAVAYTVRAIGFVSYLPGWFDFVAFAFYVPDWITIFPFTTLLTVTCLPVFPFGSALPPVRCRLFHCDHHTAPHHHRLYRFGGR